MTDLTPLDYVRGALFNALESGLTLDDVCRMSANADSPEAFDRAVNMLAHMCHTDLPKFRITPHGYRVVCEAKEPFVWVEKDYAAAAWDPQAARKILDGCTVSIGIRSREIRLSGHNGEAPHA